MKKFSVTAILLAGILWGCMGIFVRKLNALGMASMEIVGLRAFVSAIALVLFLLCMHRDKLKIKPRDIWCFLGTGICSIIFFNYCYFKTISMTSLSVAAVLLYTAPAFVMILSAILFKEKLNHKKIIALVLTFAGCILVSGFIGSGDSLSAMGVLVGLGSGLGYALYSIFGRYAIDRGYDSLTITCYTFVVAAIGSFFTTDMGHVIAGSFATPQLAGFSIAFGLLCTVAPFLLYTIGLKNIDNSKASIIATIEPVAATVLGIVLFNESLSFTGVFGMLLVLVAIVIS